MKPVIQRDRTGCAFASVAVLAHENYSTVRAAAAHLGIAVTDPTLWSDTAHIRQLLARFGLSAAGPEDFATWSALPDRALLAIKWRGEEAGAAWHWVVFVRDGSGSYVLDSKKALRRHRRTDFGRMKPKWFLRVEEVEPANRLLSPRRRSGGKKRPAMRKPRSTMRS